MHMSAPGLKRIRDWGTKRYGTESTEQMAIIVLTSEISCLDLCDILRLKLTGYVDSINLHIMNDGSGTWIGCMCK